MHEEAIVTDAKERFDPFPHTDEYRAIHYDDGHPDALLNLMDIQPGIKYPDPGTGNGHVVFVPARRYPDVSVTGIDIAENSIRLNNELREKEKIPNARFRSYGGKVYVTAGVMNILFMKRTDEK